MRERNRFLRGMTVWVGYTQAAVPYRRDPRYAGETKYTISKMLRFSLDAISSFSHRPLQLATLLGFLISTLAFVAIPVVVVLRILGSYLPGFSAITIVVLLLGGIELIAIGIIGEYVGRIYDEVKGRPLYLVRARRNMPDQGQRRAAARRPRRDRAGRRRRAGDQPPAGLGPTDGLARPSGSGEEPGVDPRAPPGRRAGIRRCRSGWTGVGVGLERGDPAREPLDRVGDRVGQVDPVGVGTLRAPPLDAHRMAGVADHRRVGGTSWMTTLLAPILAPWPTMIGPSSLAPEPIVTLSCTVGWRLPVAKPVPPSVTP